MDLSDSRRLIHKTPCAQCPWRRASAQGYMGGHDPEWYADVVSDNQVPSCHLRDFGADNPNTAYCVGALQTANNACIRPYDQAQAEASITVGRNPDTFGHPALFYAYHTFGGKYVSRLMRAMTGERSTKGKIEKTA